MQPGKPPKHADTYFEAPANAAWPPNLTNWDEIERQVTAALEPMIKGEQAAKEAAENAKRAIDALLPQGEIFR